jgi:hypothetical protein
MQKELEIDVQEFLHLRDAEKKSLKIIADFLQVGSWRRLQYWIKKNKIEYKFKKASGGSKERLCKLDRIAQAHDYNDFEHLLAENRPTKSQKEIAETFGVSLRSVAHRKPDGVKGWYRHGSANVDRENHIWKRT